MCSKGAKIAELFTKAIASTKCFDHNLRKVKVVSCGEGSMVTEFIVGPEHLNQRGTLHGAFIAHLVDAISTYALTTNETIDTRGVSIDLSISYFTAAREGDNIEVKAITKKAGKKVAFLEVEVRNKDKNIVLATDHESRHNSYHADVERAPREDTPLLHNRFPPPQGSADGEQSPLTTAVVSSLIIILLAGVIIGIYLLIEQSREENVLPPVEMAVQLVSNGQWDDSNSTRQLSLSPYRARHVVAVQTDTPECFTLHACTHLLREYQNKSGGILPHNFLISSSGHTFEALGWRRRARSYTDYTTPLVVGFIGNFTQSPPSDIQVEEAKRLLDESVSQQCLEPKYIIIGKNTRYPARHLFRRLSKLKQWDHELSDT